MELIKCPECGNDVSDQVKTCPHCGYEILEESKQIEKNHDIPTYKNRKYISILMCIIGCVLLIIAVTRITNDKYKFYEQHYQECIDGYNDTKSTANSYGSGFFGSSYNSIASSYKDMADEANKKLWKFRIQAIVLLCGGCGLIICGYKNYKKEENNGVNQVS